MLLLFLREREKDPIPLLYACKQIANEKLTLCHGEHASISEDDTGFLATRTHTNTHSVHKLNFCKSTTPRYTIVYSCYWSVFIVADCLTVNKLSAGQTTDSVVEMHSAVGGGDTEGAKVAVMVAVAVHLVQPFQSAEDLPHVWFISLNCFACACACAFDRCFSMPSGCQAALFIRFFSLSPLSIYFLFTFRMPRSE